MSMLETVRDDKVSWWEWVRNIGFAILFAVGVRTAVAEPFHVPSSSMVPTLLVGDHMFASKFAYGYSRYSLPMGLPLFDGRVPDIAPARGDVVVFKLPRDPSQDFVKRVVGLPGDRVQMIRGILHLNGAAVGMERIADFEETDASGAVTRSLQFIETLPGGTRHRMLHDAMTGPHDNTPELTVPAGQYFVMGDNRSNSADSRIPAEAGGVGFVPAEYLIGRVDLRYFSIGERIPWDPVSWLKALRPERIGLVG